MMLFLHQETRPDSPYTLISICCAGNSTKQKKMMTMNNLWWNSKWRQCTNKPWPTTTLFCFEEMYRKSMVIKLASTHHLSSTICSTRESTNYARLCRLLVDIGTQTLRDTFDTLEKGFGFHKPLVFQLIHWFTNNSKHVYFYSTLW